MTGPESRGARLLPSAIALCSCLAAGIAAADNISGEDRIVCTAWQAISCSTATECRETEAWELNLPDFTIVDLDEGLMSTPEGSDEQRSTEIETISRSETHVFLNGTQEDRGFSWAINEQTGEGTLSIVSDTTVITLYTVCAASANLR